ncbi:hypothetical protein [Citrobacter koseri]|uniref:hypothetical protein n=1 Tax=Citrobacter koseri TaxID=545 RepID=UPI000DFDA12A|nr:hypothetical protein [Citrobacter koseri]STB73293.1 Uncharacterised protein [Citrobacter koseri]STT23472.1 Uncharacterised protein [Citrobacter koseri]
MTALLLAMTSQSRGLLLCGVVLVLTAMVHVYVTVWPLRGVDGVRCIFRRPRAALLRWLSGELLPGFSLLCGLVFTTLTSAAGMVAAGIYGGEALLLPAGPATGLLVTAGVVMASLRRLRGYGLVRVVFSVLVSLMLLTCTGLVFLVCEGEVWTQMFRLK